eukprot:NODE_3951_length_869_cov_13.526954_g3796_i0.p1 GENE.NODE_3951_length_869_cov_13.526954_g3796_i0~~NODE_3951_length_869_cov_13.526954_g3796_i0.p1  ORF type:complete len:227 (-),score=44.49 NODE_3951_length_869_cov_13.526954_g3796_i0:55-735(-)
MSCVLFQHTPLVVKQGLGAEVVLTMHSTGAADSEKEQNSSILTVGALRSTTREHLLCPTAVTVLLQVSQRTSDTFEEGEVTVDIKPLLEEGDIICLDKRLFYHYGVYVGGDVIHFWGARKLSYCAPPHRMFAKWPQIKRTPFQHFVCLTESPRPEFRIERKAPESMRGAIVAKAIALLHTQPEFSMYYYDCKCFAYDCHGLSTSSRGDLASFLRKKFTPRRNKLCL